MYVVFECYTTLYDFWNISLWSRDNYATTTKNPKSEPQKKKGKNPKWGHKGAKGTNNAKELPSTHQSQARNV